MIIIGSSKYLMYLLYDHNLKVEDCASRPVLLINIKLFIRLGSLHDPATLVLV